jgi:hypothetical protein
MGVLTWLLFPLYSSKSYFREGGGVLSVVASRFYLVLGAGNCFPKQH